MAYNRESFVKVLEKKKSLRYVSSFPFIILLIGLRLYSNYDLNVCFPNKFFEAFIISIFSYLLVEKKLKILKKKDDIYQRMKYLTFFSLSFLTICYINIFIIIYTRLFVFRSIVKDNLRLKAP